VWSYIRLWPTLQTKDACKWPVKIVWVVLYSVVLAQCSKQRPGQFSIVLISVVCRLCCIRLCVAQCSKQQPGQFSIVWVSVVRRLCSFWLCAAQISIVLVSVVLAQCCKQRPGQFNCPHCRVISCVALPEHGRCSQCPNCFCCALYQNSIALTAVSSGAAARAWALLRVRTAFVGLARTIYTYVFTVHLRYF